jgi:hypothetical protein
MLSALLASTMSGFRTRAALQVEILALRHELGMMQLSVKSKRQSKPSVQVMSLVMK